MAAAANRYRRLRSQLPSCYHEGFLEKKSIKDKMGRKLWSSLCGNSLFFFNNAKDSVYIEKLELCDLMSVSDDCCRDRNLDAAGFTLHMKSEDVKMIAPTLESRELWKGFLLSISKLTVPTSLNLLPGQIHMMKGIIEKEKKRQQPPSAQSSQSFEDYVDIVPDMPSCYHNVSRVQAEMLLERNPKLGNLLLRPGHDGMSFALTTHQDINGSVFKHYRVSRRHEGGFAIDLETPITCTTLHEIVKCLVEKTDGVLVPLQMEEHYEQNITFVRENEENGEMTEHRHVPSPSPPLPPPKPAFRNENEDNCEITEHCRKTPLQNATLPAPPQPPPKPVARNHRSNSELNSPEREYLNTSDLGDYEVDEAACPVPPVLPRLSAGRYLPHQHSVPQDLSTSSDGERKVLVPPGYTKTPSRSNSVSSVSSNFQCELRAALNKRKDTKECLQSQ